MQIARPANLQGFFLAGETNENEDFSKLRIWHDNGGKTLGF